MSKTRAVLGECPVWDDQKQQLFWVDIEAGKLFAVDYTGEETSWQLPERIGSFGMTTRPDIMVVALETGFATFNLMTQELMRIALPEPLASGVRFNDGKCDRSGNFWAGTMSEAEPRVPTANLYRLSPGLEIDRMADNISVSNSLAWSPDGSSMYFADSPKKTIHRFDRINPTSPLGIGEIFVSQETFKGVPDGSDVDAAGKLWTAEWDGWRVLVHSSDGILSRVLELPAQRPTSCCFGGPNLSTLFITTASIGLSNDELDGQKEAGMVLAFAEAGQGCPSSRFNMS